MADPSEQAVTKIADRLVPIGPGEPSTVVFSGGRLGKKEAGTYQFWTAVSDAGNMTTRCVEGRDPGERFRRMEGRPIEKEHWGTVRQAKRIRPATVGEVNRWLARHEHDAPFVESGRIAGRAVRVDQTSTGRRLV